MEQVAVWESIIRSSDKDIDRVGAGYALGALAASDASLCRRQDALEALNRLLDARQHNARRAAMYGFASAGMSGVPLLMKRITSPDEYPISVIVATVFALGEACSQPTTEVVTALGKLLAHWRDRMDSYCAEVASAFDNQREVSMTERARLTSGGATSMNSMDEFATALQRGTATVSAHTFAATFRASDNVILTHATNIRSVAGNAQIHPSTWLVGKGRLSTWNVGRARSYK